MTSPSDLPEQGDPRIEAALPEAMDFLPDHPCRQERVARAMLDRVFAAVDALASQPAVEHEVCHECGLMTDGQPCPFARCPKRAQPVAERQITDEMVACAAGVVSDYVGTRVDVDAWSVARGALEAALGASSQQEPCGRMMVGSGTDTYDPLCELPEGHAGRCTSSSAVSQWESLSGASSQETGEQPKPRKWSEVKAQRAELDRLREIASEVDRAHESFCSSLPFQSPEAVYWLYREKLAGPLDRLRSALSPNQPEEE